MILGGSAEARELAARLVPGFDVITSLAGRVRNPAVPQGALRVGGFGGEAGLRKWLLDNSIDAVVDATHPFAATITENAAAACARLAIPHVILRRPPWPAGDATVVSTAAEAKDVVVAQGFSRVFLTSGRSSIGAFLFSDAWYLIRVVEAVPADQLPERHHLLLSRGPYALAAETELMRQYEIEVLVTKNSGGTMTSAKLEAAAALDVPVVMIDRPPLPENVCVVSTVDEAQRWITERDTAEA
ncbi:cobalt-precorrin-6A reductase [Mycobacterium sp. CBMA271]|uniref:cobalt-precorrin-6A reductase n=1 Tax=unclassified Mycobacteroides TaxID=2618759 RepID=UPI0012DE1B6D|nr:MULTISPECIES: cobalt-precorrin-6A reductase [unclassified Mycobacteroides]MUM18782.1 cobalt-precorrin-6A reductase [Mycobacteroides sp. CBMA 326]MUM22745.1 cobalt-precorrin-6A reductase [Mycobacteroides sp. CBMA 271]